MISKLTSSTIASAMADSQQVAIPNYHKGFIIMEGGEEV